MPRCHRCCIDFRTHQNLVEHLEQLHPSSASVSLAAPTICDLVTIMVGYPRKTIFCSHPCLLFTILHHSQLICHVETIGNSL